MYFTNLERLYIGSPDDNDRLETICLPDGIMRSLIDINWSIKVLPKNFSKLCKCKYVYLMSSPSWRNLSGVNFTPQQYRCDYITIRDISGGDAEIVYYFERAYADAHTIITH